MARARAAAYARYATRITAKGRPACRAGRPVPSQTADVDTEETVNPSEQRPNAREATPPKSRARRLAETIGLVASDAERREAFLSTPLPGPETSDQQRDAYLASAAKAGFPVSREELDEFIEDVRAGGKLAMLERHVFSLPILRELGNTDVLGSALARQSPDLVQTAAFNVRANADAREAFVPYSLDDLKPEAVFADGARFDNAMRAAGKLKPPPAQATYAQFAQTRAALRDIGVRLTVDDFKTYEAAIAKHGSAALKAPGGDAELPFAARVIVDLHRKPADREFIGASSGEFKSILAQHQKLPVNEWERNKPLQRDDAVAPHASQSNGENPYFITPASIGESPYQMTPDYVGESPYQMTPDYVGESPYQKTPDYVGDGPSRVTMIRDGVERPIPPGYRQDGKFVAIDDVEKTVFQATRAVDSATAHAFETVRYKLDDIHQSISPKELQNALAEGHTMSVSLQQGRIEVTDLTREKQLETPTLQH